jgi:hypothetical protein
MYMVVGFEVVACSIARKPGTKLEDIPCPMSPEDADAPKPMLVKEGAGRRPSDANTPPSHPPREPRRVRALGLRAASARARFRSRGF